MTYPNLNWLGRRTAGGLLDLQRTPLNPEIEPSGANPAKPRGNLNFGHTRKFLPDWPEKTVYKIRVKPTDGSLANPTVNMLELEVTVTRKDALLTANANIDTMGAGLNSNDAVFSSYEWENGDDETYASANFAVNIPYQEDTNGDGIMEQYYFIWEYESYLGVTGGVLYWVNVGPFTTSAATSPITYGAAGHKGIGPAETLYPDYQIYAKFNGSTLTAQDVLDAYTYDGTLLPMAKLMPRKASDSPHGLSAYPYLPSGNDPALTDSAVFPYVPTDSRFATIKPAVTDKPQGLFQYHTATCKWYYTPVSPCQDCWYKGKVITVEITYKKALVTMTYTAGTTEVHNSGTRGSWETHSTVTQELTLPEGFTKQQVGTTFEIPVVAGHVVCIDDIKLVSVT